MISLNNYKIRVFSVSLGILAFSLLFFFAPAVMTEGIRNGLTVCGTAVIPPLFPFMVLSDFILRSGLGDIVGRRLSPVTQRLFRLPGAAGCAVLLGLVGGFPVGARCAAQLYESGEILQKQGRRMLFFCVNAGPAFVVGTVGSSMMHSRKAGIILFVSLTLSALIIGTASRFFDRSEAKTYLAKESFDGSVISDSVSSSVEAMLNVCAWILLFFGLNAYLIRLPVSENIGTFFSVISEVTGGCLRCSGTLPAFACAFAVGWSGLAVHFQLLPYLKKLGMKLPVFWLSRLLSGTAACAIALILFKIFPCDISTFSQPSSPVPKAFSLSVPAAAAMLVLASVAVIDLNSCVKKKGVL